MRVVRPSSRADSSILLTAVKGFCKMSLAAPYIGLVMLHVSLLSHQKACRGDLVALLPHLNPETFTG